MSNPSRKPEVKTKQSLALRGKHKSEDHKSRISLSRKGNHYGPFSKEHRRNISLALKGKPKTAEHRRKTSLSMTKARRSEAAKKRWQNPVYVQKMAVIMNSPMYKEKHSQIAKRLWQNLDYRNRVCKAIMKGLGVRPTKPELHLDRLLQEWFSNNWKYVGDGQIILGGHCPDFLNINGQKKVIELFGDYWHRGENPQHVIKHYRKFGFGCLVIWEKELKEPHRLQKRIENFVRE